MERLFYFYSLALVVVVMCGMFFIEIGMGVKLEGYKIVTVTTIVTVFIAIVVTVISHALTFDSSNHDGDSSFLKMILFMPIAPITIYFSFSTYFVVGHPHHGISIALFGVVVLIILGRINKKWPFLLNKRIKSLV